MSGARECGQSGVIGLSVWLLLYATNLGCGSHPGAVMWNGCSLMLWCSAGGQLQGSCCRDPSGDGPRRFAPPIAPPFLRPRGTPAHAHPPHSAPSATLIVVSVTTTPTVQVQHRQSLRCHGILNDLQHVRTMNCGHESPRYSEGGIWMQHVWLLNCSVALAACTFRADRRNQQHRQRPDTANRSAALADGSMMDQWLEAWHARQLNQLGICSNATSTSVPLG
jgi:hypothetical protein